MPWNCFCNGGITMKKATVTVSFEQEKLKAVQFYAGKNGDGVGRDVKDFLEKVGTGYVHGEALQKICAFSDQGVY